MRRFQPLVMVPCQDAGCMDVRPTLLPEVLVIEPRVFEDARGFFLETFSARRYADSGITGPFVQDNWSHSQAGTLRGLHYQIRQTQGKLVQVMRGEIFDVAVDLRRESPTFGRWVGEILSEANRRQLWIPPGFAHGFLVLSDVADFVYKCTDYYAAEHERALLWSDPQVGIEWPLQGDPILSPRDREAAPLSRAECFDRLP